MFLQHKQWSQPRRQPRPQYLLLEEEEDLFLLEEEGQEWAEEKVEKVENICFRNVRGPLGYQILGQLVYMEGSRASK